jgi:putative transposase
MWDHLQENRKRAYLLHAFVIMPDHLHLLITPTQSIEYAMQIVKGGFSHKLRRATDRSGEVWQRGFTDHRIRDHEDLLIRKTYLENNSVARGLSVNAEEYRWSSAYKPTPAAKAADLT